MASVLPGSSPARIVPVLCRALCLALPHLSVTLFPSVQTGTRAGLEQPQPQQPLIAHRAPLLPWLVRNHLL